MHVVHARRILVMTAIGTGLIACGGGGGGDDVGYDPVQTMLALEDKVGVDGVVASLEPGEPPAPNSQDVTTDAPDTDVTAIVGARASIPVTITAGTALDSLFAKIPGANTYFEVSLEAPDAKAALKTRRSLSPLHARPSSNAVAAKGATVVNFQVDVPPVLEPGGRLCFELSARDINDQVSNPDLACLDIRAATPQPTATPTPTPPVDDDTAAACLNPALFTVGANVQQTYRETDQTANGTVTNSYDDSYTVPRETTFNGNAAVELAYAESGSEYLRAEPSNRRVLIFGFAFDGETVTYEPPFEIPLNLTPGQSQTQTITVGLSVDGVEAPVEVVSTLTYVGRERITVPAGSFETCRFRESASYSGNYDGDDLGFAQDADFWFSVGSGLTVRDEVRDQFGTYLVELQSASINGQAVTGN